MSKYIIIGVESVQIEMLIPSLSKDILSSAQTLLIEAFECVLQSAQDHCIARVQSNTTFNHLITKKQIRFSCQNK